MTAIVISTVLSHMAIVGAFLWGQRQFRKDIRRIREERYR